MAQVGCVICDRAETAQAPLHRSTCGHPRHGICQRCICTALRQPAKKNPIQGADGSMSCVAAGCNGAFPLRDLLTSLSSKGDRQHVLNVVQQRRREQKLLPPAPQNGSANAKAGAGAGSGMSREKALQAATNFLGKAAVAKLSDQDVTDYLSGKGLPADVIDAAIRSVRGANSAAVAAPPPAPAPAPDSDSNPASDGAPPAAAGPVHARTTMSHSPAMLQVDEAFEVAVVDAADVYVDGGDTCSSIHGALETKRKDKRRRLRQRVKNVAALAAQQLNRHGYAVVDGFCDAQRVREVHEELGQLQPHYTASEIWVGSEAGLGAQVSVPSVRGDKVLWMCGGHQHVAGVEDARDDVGLNPDQWKRDRNVVEPCEQAVRSAVANPNAAAEAPESDGEPQGPKPGVTKVAHSALMHARFRGLKRLMNAMDHLVAEHLAKECPALGNLAGRSDAMCAVYPGEGARFQRHIDNTANDGRRLTVICYLNNDWPEAHGGALRLHPATDKSETQARDVLPEGGRLAMFYSHTVPHEVLPAYAPRHSFTLWYYDAGEREEAVREAKELRRNLAAGAAADPDSPANQDFSADDRKAAQSFAKYLVDEGGEASLRDVVREADALSAGAKTVLAGMTGTPTGDHFVAALRRMDEPQLSELRENFTRMGI
uniref:Fe2OG dioxygenase domain-containing protein n=1 Tax=Phaeomonas parva TaxID=124430 RepID=A0A7S1UCJ3_9STRA|mmetsp:Transcript_38688/g.121203  ORF Transcript_38688/g.121203 Transcript_38688/m.121203 type:complete len:656 (+) Transcript_38688:134-2101(+)